MIREFGLYVGTDFEEVKKALLERGSGFRYQRFFSKFQFGEALFKEFETEVVFRVFGERQCSAEIQFAGTLDEEKERADRSFIFRKSPFFELPENCPDFENQRKYFERIRRYLDHKGLFISEVNYEKLFNEIIMVSRAI